MMQLNPTVGVAPGTTTLALGGLRGCALGNCPPDEAWRYTNPPDVQTGYPSGVTAGPGAVTHTSYWDPYTDFPQLKGLRDATDDTSVRWSLVVFAGLATFATVLGVRYFTHRKKK